LLKSALDEVRLLNGAGSAITIFSDMPTYEYRCEKCQGTFELFQSMKDAALEVCPKEQCRLDTWGHGKVKRLLGTGAGLIFKGSGFYVTDYRSPSYKESAKKESGAKEGGPKESGGGKTDSGAAKSGGGTGSTAGGASS
jgi:putative FmdB family regulatory protein